MNLLSELWWWRRWSCIGGVAWCWLRERARFLIDLALCSARFFALAFHTHTSLFTFLLGS